MKSKFKRLGINLVFWSISYLILFRLFTKDYHNGKADIIYTILFHLPLIALVYFNVYLIPRYLLTRKYLIYFASVLVAIAVSMGFHFILFDRISNYLFPGFYFIAYYSVFAILQFLIAYWIVSTLLILSWNWFSLKNRQIKLEQENHIVKLNALKAQLNPHFLFNSLNNIYSLFPPNQKKERDYIMKLSDSLRYMLYETDNDLVLLSSEVEYLENYIELEKLRLQNPEKLIFERRGNLEGYLIAPLVLLPLVENCFKHRNSTNPEIDIFLEMQENNQLTFTTNNSRNDEVSIGGVGIKNLKSRLEMIYPNKYQFETKADQGSYSTRLFLDLSL